MQRPLRREDVVPDAQGVQILADQGHHRVDRLGAEMGQPVRLLPPEPGTAFKRREPLAHRLQIVPGVETFRDLADRLTERLAIAQIGRTGERIHLRPGVVDVVLAADIEARLFQ